MKKKSLFEFFKFYPFNLINIYKVFILWRPSFKDDSKEKHFLELKKTILKLKKEKIVFLIDDINNDMNSIKNDFNKTGIDYVIGLCLNNKNLYFIDDFYQFFSDQKDLLFFVDLKEVSFEQKFHLSMFFEKISRDRNYPLVKRLYFKKLSDKLGFDICERKRCLWRKKGIIFKSPILIKFCPNDEETNLKDKTKIFYGNFLKKNKKRIIETKCNDCLRPDDSKVGFCEIFSFAKSALEVKKNISQRVKIINNPILEKIKEATFNNPKEWKSILITGWYGTETTGDKAILGEIVHFLRERSPECQIAISTINRKISLQTKRELEILKATELLDIEECSKRKIIEKYDAVVFGGGPIMQSNSLIDVWKIFREANHQKKARIIFGCGLGPFHTKEMEKIAKQILQMSTAGFFRDEESLDYSKRLFPDIEMDYACDPSIGYLNRIESIELNENEKKDYITLCTLLRANTKEFIKNVNLKATDELNRNFALQLANFIKEIVLKEKISVKMLSMNCHYIGGDDRKFNRMVEEFCVKSNKIYVERAYLNINDLIKKIKNCDFSLAMRYHGHLFSFALGIPFLSINYTGKDGKVNSFLRRINYEKWSLNWNEQDDVFLKKKFFELIETKDEIKNKFRKERERMLLKLETVYKKTFKN